MEIKYQLYFFNAIPQFHQWSKKIYVDKILRENITMNIPQSSAYAFMYTKSVLTKITLSCLFQCQIFEQCICFLFEHQMV